MESVELLILTSEIDPANSDNSDIIVERKGVVVGMGFHIAGGDPGAPAEQPDGVEDHG